MHKNSPNCRPQSKKFSGEAPDPSPTPYPLGAFVVASILASAALDLGLRPWRASSVIERCRCPCVGDHVTCPVVTCQAVRSVDPSSAPSCHQCDDMATSCGSFCGISGFTASPFEVLILVGGKLAESQLPIVSH